MAPSRLTDSQKQELLERYRDGETSAALADAFGCSTNTVSRTVRTLLSPEEYSALKSSRSRGASAAPQAQAAVDISPELEAAQPEALLSEQPDSEPRSPKRMTRLMTTARPPWLLTMRMTLVPMSRRTSMTMRTSHLTLVMCFTRWQFLPLICLR